MGFFGVSGGFGLACQSADGLRPQRAQQALANEIEIGERAAHKQTAGVLLKAPVANPGEARDAFDDAEGMLDPAPDTGLDTILFTRGY